MFAEDKTRTAIVEPEEQATSLYPAWADAPMDVPRRSEAESPAMLDLRELAAPEADPGLDPRIEQAAVDLPLPYFHTTGSQLRHRLVTPESIAELEAQEKPGLWSRLYRRLLRRK